MTNILLCGISGKMGKTVLNLLENEKGREKPSAELTRPRPKTLISPFTIRLTR